jgi:hypothetical protein
LENVINLNKNPNIKRNMKRDVELAVRDMGKGILDEDDTFPSQLYS